MSGLRTERFRRELVEGEAWRHGISFDEAAMGGYDACTADQCVAYREALEGWESAERRAGDLERALREFPERVTDLMVGHSNGLGQVLWGTVAEAMAEVVWSSSRPSTTEEEK